MITIELLFAAKNRVWQRFLTVPEGTTVSHALAQSDLYQVHPEAKELAYGIFGERCQPETVLQNKDRIEVYRPLVFDPMDSRRRRAAHRAEQKQNTKKRRKPSIAASMIVNRD